MYLFAFAFILLCNVCYCTYSLRHLSVISGYALMHLSSYSMDLFTYVPVRLCTYSLMHLSDYAPIHLCTYPLMHLSAYASIQLSTYPLMHLFTNAPARFRIICICTICLCTYRIQQCTFHYCTYPIMHLFTNAPVQLCTCPLM